MGSAFKDKIEREIPLSSLPKIIGGQHAGDADFSFDLAYFGAPLHFSHSCPSSMAAGVIVEDKGGATITLASLSTGVDVAHPLSVSVVLAGADPGSKAAPPSEVPVPMPATSAYAVQMARFFSDAAAVARRGTGSDDLLWCAAAATTVVDFDCGAGLLACVLADISRQPQAQAGTDSAAAHIRAVCCNEDISSSAFELLGKNVARANAGATPALISVHEYAADATSHDTCPAELVAGADAVVLRFETFVRGRQGDAALDNLKGFVGSLCSAAPGVATLVLAVHVKAARLFATADQPAAVGAATVAKAFKAALSPALAAHVRFVAAPDNRTHFVVASPSAARSGPAPLSPFALAVGGKEI